MADIQALNTHALTHTHTQKITISFISFLLPHLPTLPTRFHAGKKRKLNLLLHFLAGGVARAFPWRLGFEAREPPARHGAGRHAGPLGPAPLIRRAEKVVSSPSAQMMPILKNGFWQPNKTFMKWPKGSSWNRETDQEPQIQENNTFNYC